MVGIIKQLYIIRVLRPSRHEPILRGEIANLFENRFELKVMLLVRCPD